MSAVLPPAVFAVYLTACAKKYPVVLEAPVERHKAHAEAESGFRPFVIHANAPFNRSFDFATKAEAVAKARALLAQGVRIDAGVMQVDSANWAAYGLTVATAFDPEANICAGARILGIDFQTARAAACLYNTGHQRCSNGYPETVQRAEMRLAQQSGAPATAEAAEIKPSPPKPEPGEPPLWDKWAYREWLEKKHARETPNRESSNEGPQ